MDGSGEPYRMTEPGFGSRQGKFSPDGGAAFYQRMAELGLRQTVITVRWTPSDPFGLPEEGMLDATVAAATAAGLRVVFAVYPYPPRARQPSAHRSIVVWYCPTA